MEIPCIVGHPNEKNKSCKRPCLKKTKQKKNPKWNQVENTILT